MDELSWSERLRERARELEIADSEVARRAGLSQVRYANYVAGRREPDFATLLRICRVLQTTPDIVLGVASPKAGVDAVLGRVMSSLALLRTADLEMAAHLLSALALHANQIERARSPKVSAAARPPSKEKPTNS